MQKPFRDYPDRGDNLLGLVIAMFVFALVLPGLLVLLTRSQQLATAAPDWDEGIQARAELAELFGSVDPIGQCASPSGGRDAAYRSSCFREERYAGASLVSAPVLPAASPPTACWLTASDSGTRHRRCIVLEGDTDEPECVNPPVGPCLQVLSELTGESVNVDRYGGGRLLVRSWAETDSDSDPDTVPFLPHEWDDQPTDRLIYTDAEWWCLRWRSPDGSGSVTSWTGECPDPTDPAEWHDASDAATWPQSSPQPVPALPDAAAPGPDDGSGALTGPHTLGDRLTDVELLVCVASTYADRLQGAPHCSVDLMRFNIADPHGWMPPRPGVRLADPRVAADGLTVEEGTRQPLAVRLGLQPTADVTVTVSAPTGVTATPATLIFTPDNWDQLQNIDVEIPDDATQEDEQRHTLTLTTTSIDPSYSGLDPEEVQVTVPASDHPELLVDPDALAMDETDTATLDVSLATAPLFNVTVTVTSDDLGAVTVSPSSLTFTSGNWDTPQPITVTAVDDADTSDESATVELDPMSVDGDYNAPERDVSVPVTVTDNDTP